MAKNYDLFLRGYVGGGDFDSMYVDYILDKYSEREVAVLIDSTGGQTNTALSICAAFANHGNVTVHFQGMSASAATIAALGAKKVSIEDSACYLVHKCSTEFFDWSTKNADQLDTYIKDLQACKENLDKIDLHVASLYAARCNKPTAEILDLMKVGGWLTPSEAKEWGFVDEIVEGVSKKNKTISSFFAEEMIRSGLTIPPNVDIDMSERRKGLFDIFKSHIKSFSKSENMDKKAKSEEPPVNEQEAQTNQTNQTAGVNAEINKLRSELDDERKKHSEEIAALNSKIEELKKGPADSSSSVVESNKKTDGEKSPLDSFMAASASASKLFNSIP